MSAKVVVAPQQELKKWPGEKFWKRTHKHNMRLVSDTTPEQEAVLLLLRGCAAPQHESKNWVKLGLPTGGWFKEGGGAYLFYFRKLFLVNQEKFFIF